MCRQSVQRLSIQWVYHMAASPQSERRSRAGGAAAPWPLYVISTHRRPPPGANCSHRRSVCVVCTECSSLTCLKLGANVKSASASRAQQQAGFLAVPIILLLTCD